MAVDVTDELLDAAQFELDSASGLLSWADPEARVSESGLKFRVRRTRPVPADVWVRGSVRMVPVLERVPWPRHSMMAGEARTARPYELLSRVLPESMNFEWLSLGRTFSEWQSRDAQLAGDAPRRVPSWAYGQDPAQLLRFCREAPSRGWDRVVVGWLPASDRRETSRIHEWLFRVSCAFPDVPLHWVTGKTNYSRMFGLNFGSVDAHPWADAKFHELYLPNGRKILQKDANLHLKWLHVLGWSVKDLRTLEDQAMFNLASLAWASEHWGDSRDLPTTAGRDRSDPLGLLALPREKRRPGAAKPRALGLSLAPVRPVADSYGQFGPDSSEPYALVFPVSHTRPVPVRPRTGFTGDKITCSSCSLAVSCRKFREGAICTVNDSETAKLAELLGTRDSSVVKSALTAILSAQTDRYERSAVAFKEDGESDIFDLRRSDHLMKMENSILRSMEVLVKILDPTYRPDGPAPALQSSTVNVYNPQVLIAQVVRELEEQGVDRSTLTPEMLAGLVQGHQSKQLVQGTVVE